MCGRSRLFSHAFVGLFLLLASGEALCSTGRRGTACACQADLVTIHYAVVGLCNGEEGGPLCDVDADCPEGRACIPCPDGPNGSVDFPDLAYLVDVMIGRTPRCEALDADVNCDGVVDFTDISAGVCQFRAGFDCCNQVTGACCTPEGPCVETDRFSCETFGPFPLSPGIYLGDGISCNPGPCDCNHNGVDDEDDINVGSSEDCNLNGSPDECDMAGCCLEDEEGQYCTMTTEQLCVDAGGVPRGPCAPCPDQNAAVIQEPGGDVVIHIIGAPSECSAGGKAMRPNKAQCGSGPFVDVWVSTENLCHNFGSASTDPIPSDFFGPGSDPFTDVLCLHGVPLGIPEFGDADTLVQRAGDPFDRCDPVLGAPSTVDADVVALSMASNSPITVTYGGTNPEQWDATVDISPYGTLPGTPQSTVAATRKHCNGGTYTSVLYVQPRFTFTKVGDPGEVRILDTHLAGTSPVRLDQLQELWWVIDLDPELGLQTDPCTDFHPGVIAYYQETDCDCNVNSIRDSCDIEAGASTDCNTNTVPDECDIAQGTSVDSNGDGLPDECTFVPDPAVIATVSCDGDDDCQYYESCVGGYCGMHNNRYLSIVPPQSMAGREIAIRVRTKDGPCAAQVRFAGPPEDFPEKNLGDPQGWFTGAYLHSTTEPHYDDWMATVDGVVHLFGVGVRPSTTYEIKLVDATCPDLANEGCYSPALTISTAKWGDIVAPFHDPANPVIQPDFGDISGLVEKFQGRAYLKAQAKLQPEVPDPTQAVDFKDIGAGVDAFKGTGYPYGCSP